MSKPVFVTRPEAPKTDYIALANDQITKNGTIDVESQTYKNAIEQYNEGFLKGRVERLEVPRGFCGYIDPKTGKFRVEPIQLESTLKSSTLYPDNVVNPETIEDIVPTPYPVDQCLAQGLPGSQEYTAGNCGEEDGDNECSDIEWFPPAENTEEGGGGGGGTGSQGAPYTGGTQNVTITFVSADANRIVWSPKQDYIAKGWTPGALGSTDIVGTVHFFRKIGGSWVGGKFEWFRNSYTSQGAGNILAGYGGHTIPNAGEDVAIMLVSTDKKYRSNLVSGKWASNSSATGSAEAASAAAGAVGMPPPTVCGGGPGINSNVGLAAAAAVAGLSSSVPDKVREVADPEALGLYECAGFSRSVGAAGTQPNTVKYTLYYNINIPCDKTGPLYFKKDGLIIYVIYNKSDDSAELGDPSHKLNV